MFTVTVPGVFKLLSKPNPKKSTGPDELSPLVLKKSASDISVVLTFIYNQSLSSGTVPADWRMANIFALHKKGPKDLAENYRPISLTSVCCKTLEHIVYSNICKFFDISNILTPKQRGFRPGFSCETQLILSIDDWARSLASCFRTDVVIFDFSKAFDSIPHTRLLGKLHYFGICGQMLTWFSSSLLSRYQRVVNGSQSSWSDVISGVLQGTVLGPLLVIEPILVVNLVRARSSWLRLCTEPPADRSPNRRRIVSMRRSTHTWPTKLCREAWGRKIAD